MGSKGWVPDEIMAQVEAREVRYWRDHRKYTRTRAERDTFLKGVRAVDEQMALNLEHPDQLDLFATMDDGSGLCKD